MRDFEIYGHDDYPHQRFLDVNMLNSGDSGFPFSSYCGVVVDQAGFRNRWSAGQEWSAGQVRYGGIRRSSASPRPPCDGTPSASVWPSPRQTPGPPCPYSPDRTPPDATMKRVDAPSAWSSPSDLGIKVPIMIKSIHLSMASKGSLTLNQDVHHCRAMVGICLAQTLPPKIPRATDHILHCIEYTVDYVDSRQALQRYLVYIESKSFV